MRVLFSMPSAAALETGRSLAVVLAFSVLAVGSARAESMDAFLDRMKDVPTTLRLENEVADLLGRGDRAGLRAKAREVTRSDQAKTNAVFNAIKRAVVDSGVEANARRRLAGRPETEPRRADSQLIDKVGPCHMAGLSVRTLLIGLDGRRVAFERKGDVFVTRPRGAGDVYAEEIRRCEVIRNLPKSARRIGSTCHIDGLGCE